MASALAQISFNRSITGPEPETSSAVVGSSGNHQIRLRTKRQGNHHPLAHST